MCNFPQPASTSGVDELGQPRAVLGQTYAGVVASSGSASPPSEPRTAAAPAACARASGGGKQASSAVGATDKVYAVEKGARQFLEEYPSPTASASRADPPEKLDFASARALDGVVRSIYKPRPSDRDREIKAHLENVGICSQKVTFSLVVANFFGVPLRRPINSQHDLYGTLGEMGRALQVKVDRHSAALAQVKETGRKRKASSDVTQAKSESCAARFDAGVTREAFARVLPQAPPVALGGAAPRPAGQRPAAAASSTPRSTPPIADAHGPAGAPEPRDLARSQSLVKTGSASGLVSFEEARARTRAQRQPPPELQPPRIAGDAVRISSEGKRPDLPLSYEGLYYKCDAAVTKCRAIELECAALGEQLEQAEQQLAAAAERELGATRKLEDERKRWERERAAHQKDLAAAERRVADAVKQKDEIVFAAVRSDSKAEHAFEQLEQRKKQQADALKEAERAHAEQLEQQRAALQATIDEQAEELAKVQAALGEAVKAADAARIESERARAETQRTENGLKSKQKQLVAARKACGYWRSVSTNHSEKIETLKGTLESRKRLRGPEMQTQLRQSEAKVVQLEADKVKLKGDAERANSKAKRAAGSAAYAKSEAKREVKNARRQADAESKKAERKLQEAREQALDLEQRIIDPAGLEDTQRELADAEAAHKAATAQRDELSSQLRKAEAEVKKLNQQLGASRSVSNPTAKDMRKRRAELQAAFLQCNTELGIASNRLTQAAETLLQAAGINMDGARSKRARKDGSRAVVGIPSRTTAQRLTALGDHVADFQAAVHISADLNKAIERGEGPEGVAGAACFDGAATAGMHFNMATLKTESGSLALHILHTDGHDTGKDIATGYSKALKQIAKVVAHLTGLGVGAIDGVALAKSDLISERILSVVITDSASAEQKAAEQLGIMKQATALADEQKDIALELARALDGQAGSFTVTVVDEQGQTVQQSFNVAAAQLASDGAPATGNEGGSTAETTRPDERAGADPMEVQAEAEAEAEEEEKAPEPERRANAIAEELLTTHGDLIEAIRLYRRRPTAERRQRVLDKLEYINCLLHAVMHALTAGSDAVEDALLQVLPAGFIDGEYTSLSGHQPSATKDGKVQKDSGGYSLRTRPLNHLIHTLTKMFARVATKDWSLFERFIKFVIDYNNERDDGIRWTADQIRGLVTGFGRTCGARGGATTLNCTAACRLMYLWILFTEDELACGEKLSASHRYSYNCLTRPEYQAAIYAKGICGPFFYTQVLAELHRVESEGTVATELQDVCTRVYEVAKSIGVDATRFMRREVDLFAGRKRMAMVDELLRERCEAERRGAHGVHWEQCNLTKRFIEVFCAAFATRFNHFTVRWQLELATPDDPLADLLGSMRDLDEQRALALRNAHTTGAPCERIAGMLGEAQRTGRTTNAHHLASKVRAKANKTGTFLIGLRPEERKLALKVSRKFKRQDDAVNGSTLIGRLARHAALSRPKKLERKAKLTAKRDKEEQHKNRIVEEVAPSRVTRWSQLAPAESALSAPALLDQIDVFRFVDKSKVVPKSRSGKKEKLMGMLADLVVGKYGEAAKDVPYAQLMESAGRKGAPRRRGTGEPAAKRRRAPKPKRRQYWDITGLHDFRMGATGPEVLVGWEPTDEVDEDGYAIEDDDGRPELKHWPPSWQPLSDLSNDAETMAMLDQLLKVADGEALIAWDDKVQALIDSPLEVGTRVIVQLPVSSDSEDTDTFSGVIKSVDQSADKYVVEPVGAEPRAVPREAILSKAPPPSTAKKGLFVRALLETEIDDEACRVWSYGKLSKLLSGNEVAVVRTALDDADALVPVYDLQDARTGEWLTTL